MHADHEYTINLCTKCTVYGENLMFRGTAKFTTDKTNIDTINKHIKNPKTSHNVLYYEYDSEKQKMITAIRCS